MSKTTIVIESTAPYVPIACAEHDYLETACLYHYELVVFLKTSHKTLGQFFTAQARTTKTSTDKKEYWVLETDTAMVEIAMDQLVSVSVKTPGAMFDSLRFD